MGASLCNRRARPPPPSPAAFAGPVWAGTEAQRPGRAAGAAGPGAEASKPPAQNYCSACGKVAGQRCGTCQAEFYCGRSCQEKSWKKHKEVCGARAAARLNALANGRDPPVAFSRTPLCGLGFQGWLAAKEKASKGREIKLPELLPDEPRVGFSNWTNNCYLNAVYQCLLHTPLLRQNLLQASPRPEDKWLAELIGLFKLVDEARERRARSVDPPRRLARLVAEANDEFTMGRQADAHEAIMLLIQRWLTGCLAAGDGSGVDCAKLKYEERERLEASSLIGHVFGMSMGQTISCESCSYSSNVSRVEYCMCLTVTLGMTQAELQRCRQDSQAQLQWYLMRPNRAGGGSESSVRPTSLPGLLGEYTKREHIPDFKCEKCKCSGGYRAEFIRRGPNVLMVYLDRRQDSHMFGKINRRVDFAEELDLGPWLRSGASSGAPANGGETSGGVGVVPYHLYAMCVHCDTRGSTASGHYVAYARDRHGGWHHIDDTVVRPVPWEEVQTQHPYILFYTAESIQPPLTLEPRPIEKSGDEKPEAGDKEAEAAHGANGSAAGAAGSADAAAPATPTAPSAERGTAGAGAGDGEDEGQGEEAGANGQPRPPSAPEGAEGEAVADGTDEVGAEATAEAEAVTAASAAPGGGEAALAEATAALASPALVADMAFPPDAAEHSAKDNAEADAAAVPAPVPAPVPAAVPAADSAERRRRKR